MSIPDWASTVSGALAVGIFILAILKLWIRSLQQDTRQLQHNGGNHVADYARDARDAANRAVAILQDHLLEAAAKDAEQDALLRVLMADREIRISAVRHGGTG